MEEDVKMEDKDNSSPPLSRSVASKVSIKDIVDGEFVRGDSRWEPNCILTPLMEEVSRIRVLGNVVSRYVDEGQRYASIALDDGSGTISARVFQESVALLREVKLGDIVDVIGKVKEYEDERYINLESVWRVDDPNWELVRRLELLVKKKRLEGKETIRSLVRDKEVKKEEEVEEEVVSEDLKPLVSGLIEKLDEGEGVKYAELLKESKLEEEKLEEVLNELMGDGEIYEPKIGRFKKV